jgi:PQQ-like domain
MIKLARAFTAVLTGLVASGFSWCLVSPRVLCASDDTKAAKTDLTASAPASVDPAAGSPAVALFRGGPQRTGSVSGSHLAERPVVQWTTPLPDPLGQPLLADGVIYVGDQTGRLLAIKLTDGSI